MQQTSVDCNSLVEAFHNVSIQQNSVFVESYREGCNIFLRKSLSAHRVSEMLAKLHQKLFALIATAVVFSFNKSLALWKINILKLLPLILEVLLLVQVVVFYSLLIFHWNFAFGEITDFVVKECFLVVSKELNSFSTAVISEFCMNKFACHGWNYLLEGFLILICLVINIFALFKFPNFYSQRLQIYVEWRKQIMERQYYSTHIPPFLGGQRDARELTKIIRKYLT